MSEINRSTSLLEIAALVSQALDAAGIVAVLSGGAAVSLYGENEYESVDLDFITSARNADIAKAVEPLGFKYSEGKKDLVHASSEYTIEFPPGPLAFGNTFVSEQTTSIVETEFGPLRIITPTQSVMDRLAHYVSWHDSQAFDQAVMVARRCRIDWDEMERWVERESAPVEILQRLRAREHRADRHRALEPEDANGLP